MDDKQKVAQSYILTFYANVQNIKTHYSSFLSLLLQFENMYPDTKHNNFADLSDIPPEHKNQLLGLNSDMRFYIQSAYFDFIGIISNKKISCDKEVEKIIKEIYVQVKKDLFISRDIVEDYIISLNKFMVSDIMKELIDQSQNFVNEIYEDDRTSTE